MKKSITKLFLTLTLIGGSFTLLTSCAEDGINGINGENGSVESIKYQHHKSFWPSPIY